MAWIGIAGALGFTISAVFSSMLELPRAPFVVVHAVGVGGLAALFFRARGLRVAGRGQHRPAAALAAGLLFGGILMVGVLDGPGGESPSGVRLAAALGWYGLVYGVVDALLLTIIPVLAVRDRWGPAPPGSLGKRLQWDGAALAASLLVTALYHAGFAEYRGVSLVQPLIGNTIVTAGYLLTGNAATPLVAHVLMHGAAVVQGPEATAQLPPHYRSVPLRDPAARQPDGSVRRGPRREFPLDPAGARQAPFEDGDRLALAVRVPIRGQRATNGSGVHADQRNLERGTGRAWQWLLRRISIETEGTGERDLHLAVRRVRSRPETEAKNAMAARSRGPVGAVPVAAEGIQGDSRSFHRNGLRAGLDCPAACAEHDHQDRRHAWVSHWK
jgi:hypothetical protein